MSTVEFKLDEVVRLLSSERNLSQDLVLQALADALVAAYKSEPGAAAEAEVEIDAGTYDYRVIAYDIDEDGNWVNPREDTRKSFGRIGAQRFRQVFTQRVREVERERKYEEYAGREGDIVTGIVQQTDHRYTLLDLGKVEALLPQAEQVSFEKPTPSTRLKAYIVEVRRTPKGPQIVVSRTHPGLIEIKACAREPGHRTKIAVASNDHNIDPVGACVGARGARVRMVVTELKGEKIDIVPFSEDIPDFIAKALSPAKVKEVLIDEESGRATVVVPDGQLSLAIGKEGQNARLAARLTGWGIDIKSDTQMANEAAGIFPTEDGLDDDVEYAEGEWVTDPDSGEMVWRPAEGGESISADEWAAGPAADDEGAAPAEAASASDDAPAPSGEG
jgi:transcription termination/antitermination protein NusA